MRRLGKLGGVGLCALILVGVLAGVSAQAALRAIVDQRAKAAGRAAPPRGYEAKDHFPGAAYDYAAEPVAALDAAAMRGATGTTALPDLPLSLPVAAATLAPDGSVRPAAPFSMARASATDRGRALECLTTAIYYEAASEPDAGQQAVAQVILNRVRHPAFPATVCGVVFQGSEHAGCQFSFACDGAMARGAPSRAYWTRALRVAAAALNGRVMGAVGLATHYHTYAVTPSWNRSLVMTAAIGAHFFHRWQGWWGTPAAFRQNYVGGEPVPGPHPRIGPPVILAAAALPAPPLSAPPLLPVTTTPTAAIRPAYAQSGAVMAAAASDRLPGDAQMLDRWRDTGKPLR